MKPLFKILHHSMLVNSLIPLLLIEMALLVLYFGINHYSSNQNQQLLLDQVLTNIEQTNQHKAHSITLTLNEVNHLTGILASSQQRFFESLDKCVNPDDISMYAKHKNGVFYKPVDDGGSSLYVSSTTPLTEQVRKKAVCSARLDPLLTYAVKNTPSVTQAYLNTWDDIVRIYPYIDDIPEKLGPNLHIQDFNFYYEADQEHNPLGGTVWTNAYLDPAGQGWMVSAIFPIYQNGFLEGVGGLDITINNFIQDILGIQLPDYATAIMLDEKGSILAMPEKAEQIVGLKDSDNYNIDLLLTKTIERPDEFNITQDQKTDFSKLYQKLINTDKAFLEGQINGKPYFMFVDTISYTNWQLIMLIDKQKALSPVSDMKNLTTHLGWIAVFAVVIFYSLFFVYLKSKSAKLSTDVAHPIEVLSEKTKNITQYSDVNKLPHTEIQELYQLNENFTTMQSRLMSQTQELINAEVKQQLMEQEKDLLTRMANTDPLTQTANRLKIEEVLEQEIKLSSRYGTPFSLIMIDIDLFKNVNDTYGHDVGDQVLVKFVEVIRAGLRETDLLGRWGGEEFIALCRHSSLNDTVKIAEGLREAIEKTTFSTQEQMTASFGISSYEDGEAFSQTIVRADKALYEAKHKGRNRCVAIGA